MASPLVSLLESGGVSYTVKQLPHTTLHLIELCREKALNALLPSTYQALHSIVDIAKAPCHILIRGRGRAFCAGGDVRALRTKILEAGPVGSDQRRLAAADTLKIEYDFLERLAALRGSGMVTVGVCEGYAFGAGMGLFEACAIRLVGSKALFCMPEVQIGIIPDCGATFYYPRMPGCVGMYAALTSLRINAADALSLGLADAGIAPGWFGEDVGEGEEGVLKCAAQAFDSGTDLGDTTSERRRRIDEWFSAGTLDDVLKNLEGHDDDWVMEAKKMIKKASPSALKEAFGGMREGYAGGGLKEAVTRELRIDSVLGSRWDFEEGVRSMIIDKDNDPKWEGLSSL